MWSVKALLGFISAIVKELEQQLLALKPNEKLQVIQYPDYIVRRCCHSS
jgi:hypothetical protein